MIPITQLLNPPTEDQLVAQFTAILVSLGVPADQWRTGGTYSYIRRVFCRLCAGFASSMALVASAGFLNTATGGWLTLLAYYVYGVTRIPSTFASGFLTLTNAGGGIFAFAPFQATFRNTATGATFQNVTALSLGALATQTISIQATTSGGASSSGPGAIDALVTTMPAVSIANATAIVGLDAQSDTDLRAACTNKLGALSVRGPRSAYAYAVSQALQLDGVTPVNINRVSVSSASHAGVVTVYLASPSGAPTSTDVTAVGVAIETYARPSGVTVNALPVTAVSYTPAIVVWAQALPGVAAGDVAAAATTAINSFLSVYPIGGLATDTAQGLFASGIDGVIKATNPSIFAVTGATDLPLLASQVAVNGSTVTVRQVAAS